MNGGNRPLLHPFCVISVGYYLELHVAMTFLLKLSLYYLLSYIILFSVHTNYLC
jgi:hypothetical protein